MERISVVGTSGSGKSWLASRLAEGLDLPYLELDAIRHQPGWEPLDDSEFIRRVAAFVAQDRWVVDGNYFELVTGPIVWPVASTVVWVDLPRTTVMRRVVWRTLKRCIFRQELWNGNREQLRWIFSRDPYKSIILWSWSSHRPTRLRYQAAMAETRWSAVRFARLRSARQVRHFVEEQSRSR